MPRPEGRWPRSTWSRPEPAHTQHPSRVRRPCLSVDKALGARRWGPCACIDHFERAGAALHGVGTRRSAQMAVLRIDHPDVLEFIDAKRRPGRWSHFNVSVAVPDAFFRALEQDDEWALLHRAEPVGGANTAAAEPGCRVAGAAKQPVALRARMPRHGLRNSHLLSVAPAGSVSLAFADNCSSGIEPAFAWAGIRRVLQPDGCVAEYAVENHAWRIFSAQRHQRPHAPAPPEISLLPKLPPAFVAATEVRPQDHLAMMQAVQPFVDAAISKTVHLAPDVPCQRFEALFLQAWRNQLKGLTVYRPSVIR